MQQNGVKRKIKWGLLDSLLVGSGALILTFVALLVLVYGLKGYLVEKVAERLFELDILIEESFEVTWRGGVVEVDVGRMTAYASQENPNRHIEALGLSLAIDLSGLLRRHVELKRFTADSVSVWSGTFELDKKATDSRKQAPQTSPDEGWTFGLGQVAVDGLQINRLDDLGATEDTLSLSRIALYDREAAVRRLSVDGEYKEQQFAIAGNFEGLDEFLLHDDDLRFSLQFSTALLEGALSGRLPDNRLEGDVTIDADLFVPEVGDWLAWFDLEEKFQGDMRVKGKLEGKIQEFKIKDLFLGLQGDHAQAQFQGEITHGSNIPWNVNGRLTAATYQFGRVLEGLNLICPGCSSLSVHSGVTGSLAAIQLTDLVTIAEADYGRLSFAGKKLAITPAQLIKNSGGKGLTVEGRLDADIHDMASACEHWQQSCEDMQKAELTADLLLNHGVIKASSITAKAANNAMEIMLSGDAINLNVSNLADLSLQLENTELEVTDLTEQPAVSYGAMINQLDLSGDSAGQMPFTADLLYKGVRVKPQGILDLSGKAALVNAAGTADDGQISVSLDQATYPMTLNLDVDLPDVTVLSKIIETPAIANHSASLRSVTRIGEQQTEVTSFKLTVKDNHRSTQLQGKVGDLLKFDDFNFTVDVSADHLGDLEKWIRNNEENLALTIDAFTFAESFAIKKPEKLKTLEDRWFIELFDEIDLAELLRLLPVDKSKVAVGLRLTGTGDRYDISDFTIDSKQENASFAWRGQIQDLNGRQLSEARVSAELQPGFFSWIVDPFNVEADFWEADGKIEFRDIKAYRDKQSMVGEVMIFQTGEVDRVVGSFEGTGIDAVRWAQLDKQQQHRAMDTGVAKEPVKVSGKLDTAEAAAGPVAVDKPDAVATPESLVPDLSFDLSGFEGVDLDITLGLDSLVVPLVSAGEIRARLIANEQSLKLDLVGKLKNGAAYFDVDVKKVSDGQQVGIVMTGKGIGAENINRAVGQEVVKSADTDVLLKLQGSGKDLKGVLATGSGELMVATHEAVMISAVVDDLAPNVLVEVNRRLNPFYETRPADAEVECSVIYFDIKNGVWTADQSVIVVTPDVNFGASGELDMRTETLRFVIAPKARRGLGFSVTGKVASMAAIEGPFADPSVKIDTARALLKGGQTVVGTVFLGPLYWLSYGQLTKFMSDATGCRKLIEEHPINVPEKNVMVRQVEGESESP